jgi:hypothetical protein
MNRVELKATQARLDAERIAAFEKQNRDDKEERARWLEEDRAAASPEPPPPASEPESPLEAIKKKFADVDLDPDISEQLMLSARQLAARQCARTFLRRHPELNATETNLDAITNLMIEKHLQPTVKNFELAYSTLQEANLLEEAV